MTNDVKPGADHAAMLMGLAFDRIRVAFDDPRWGGLRQSHLRIISSITAAGVRAADLARRLRMTKQGAGQLIATLVERGLVEQVADPADGRARLLVLTPAGSALRDEHDREVARIESGWADEVGATDYATFRRVLERIAVGGRDEPRA